MKLLLFTAILAVATLQFGCENMGSGNLRYRDKEGREVDYQYDGKQTVPTTKQQQR